MVFLFIDIMINIFIFKFNNLLEWENLKQYIDKFYFIGGCKILIEKEMNWIKGRGFQFQVFYLKSILKITDISFVICINKNKNF